MPVGDDGVHPARGVERFCNEQTCTTNVCGGSAAHASVGPTVHASTATNATTLFMHLIALHLKNSPPKDHTSFLCSRGAVQGHQQRLSRAPAGAQLSARLGS